jgi:hAT family C-terminal dimerisation region
MGLPSKDIEKDEFESYAHSDPTPIPDPKTFNPISWWDNAKSTFPSLHLYAFDTLTIPAMSAECERVFNSTKELTTPRKEPSGEGDHRSIRVLEELVGPWANSAA